MQTALKPASKTLGLHGVSIRGKGLKWAMADSTFKRAQIDARAFQLDIDEHHRGLALRARGATNCSEWNVGREGVRLGHDASLDIDGTTTHSSPRRPRHAGP